MRLISIIILFLQAVCMGHAYGQTITNGDGSPLTTQYCYKDTLYPIAGSPAGGTFSGCGMVQQAGQWYYNPVAASAGITVFPYQCAISYTVNGHSVSRNILVFKPVVISPPLQDSATCNGAFVLDAKTLYAGAYNYLWTPAAPLADPTSNHTEGFINTTTTFVIIAEDLTSGCVGTDTVTITRHPVPEVKVTPDNITILSREQVVLNASGAKHYQWLPPKWLSSDTIANPVASPQAPLTYSVIGTNDEGCSDTAEVVININEAMYVPNAFSPNGDGVNDIFKVENIGYQGVEEFRIFNRWGQLVYETLDGSRGWNGYQKDQPADAGTYYYIIQLRHHDNTARVFKGEVLLIR
jgi:gliding motility-associated-like protein